MFYYVKSLFFLLKLSISVKIGTYSKSDICLDNINLYLDMDQCKGYIDVIDKYYIYNINIDII